MVRRRRTARKKSSRGRLAVGHVAGLRGAPAKRTGGWVALVLGALVVVNLYVFVWDKRTSVGAIKEQAESKGPAMAVAAQPLADAPAAVPHPAQALPPVAAPIAPPGAIEGKVGKSDTLGRLLKHNGLSAAETDEVIRALSGVFDFKTMRAGQTFRIERGADGRVKKFELVVSKILTVRAERDAAGVLDGKADSVETHTEIKAIGGRIDSSLYATIKAAGENPALVDFFVDVFAYDIDFYNDTQDGDTFRVVVEKELDAKHGELVRYKRILAAEYAGKVGTFRTFFFKDGYYSADGESSEKTLLKTPLKFQRVSSGFDRARMHPVLHEVRAHLGIDYAAPTGTPVWAAAPGTIVSRGEAGGAGNMVTIRHDGGIETAYMHLSKFADGQKVGQHVAAKTVIGYVGATGLATGPHLHFGVKQNGEYIDPSKLVPLKGKAIAAKDLDAFKAEVASFEAQLVKVPIAKPTI